MNILDTLGPIMIGPSSSHTAGACKLANVARRIIEDPFHEVVFYLHGSFKDTYFGHGTDRALVAGVLGMAPDDERLIDSFEIAKEQGINFRFEEADLGYVHPNTVKMVFTLDDGVVKSITGSSVGGGAIEITDLNGVPVSVSGSRPTIIVKYTDKRGVIHRVSEILLSQSINIASMKVTRDDTISTMIVEMDAKISEESYEKIRNQEGVKLLANIGGVE
ncbi:L-serine ammonia-lyase, iron-sulfur-dependent subunit beta [Guggenheimella bovis]